MPEYRTYKIVKGTGMGGFLSPPGHWSHTYSLEEYTSPRGRKVIGCYGLDYVDSEYAHPTPAIKAQADRIRQESQTIASELWIRHAYGYFRNTYRPENESANASDFTHYEADRVVANHVRSILGARDITRGGMTMFMGPKEGAQVRLSPDYGTAYVYWLTGEGDRENLVTLDDAPVFDLIADAMRQAGYEPEIQRERVMIPGMSVPERLPAERHAAVCMIREYYPDHAPRLDLIENPGKGYGSYPCTKCGERVQYCERLDALAIVRTRIPGSGITQWSYTPECSKGGQHTTEDMCEGCDSFKSECVCCDCCGQPFGH